MLIKWMRALAQNFHGASRRKKMLDSFLGVVNQVWNDGLYGIGITELIVSIVILFSGCLLYTSPSPRDLSTSRMPSSA